MRHGNPAGALVGFPTRHLPFIQTVANRLDTVISFRAVGTACTQLIEEGYAMKGFRIDTKSCDWGPMRGFVCADPRFNKEGMGKYAFNLNETRNALHGELRLRSGISVEDHVMRQIWRAATQPLVISKARYVRMRIEGHVRGTREHATGHITGVSAKGDLRLPWRLIPLGDPNARTVNAGGHYYAIALDSPRRGLDRLGRSRAGRLLAQGDQILPAGQRYEWLEHPAGTWHELVLGLTNPGTEHLGHRACVTGDYDLFAVWPRVDAVDPRGADVRHVTLGRGQHFMLGNITQRIAAVKDVLNAELRGAGAFRGGDLVHHSDEVGNPGGLAKPLRECLPVIGFIPRQPQAWGLENLADLRQFVLYCLANRYRIDVKRGWFNQIGLPYAEEDDA